MHSEAGLRRIGNHQFSSEVVPEVNQRFRRINNKYDSGGIAPLRLWQAVDFHFGS